MKTMKIKLYEKTMAALAVTDLKISVIAREMGVTPEWVFKVRKRSIAEPSVQKIELLYDILTRAL